MENLPEVPPVQARPSHKKLWIGLGIGAVLIVLCLCVVVIVVAVVLRPNVNRLIQSMNPAYELYENADYNISFYYPGEWDLEDNSDSDYFSAAFLTDKDMLDSETIETGQAGFIVRSDDLAYYEEDLDTTSETFLADYLDYSNNDYMNEVGDLREFKLSGFPAVTQLYSDTQDFENAVYVYNLVILPNDEQLYQFLFVCTEEEWNNFKPVFDDVIKSMEITE